MTINATSRSATLVPGGDGALYSASPLGIVYSAPVTRLYPTAWTAGTMLTLESSSGGFGTTQGYIYINGTSQTILSWDSTVVTVTASADSASLGAITITTAVPLFVDGFETGDRSTTMNGVAWGSNRTGYPGGAVSGDGSAISVKSGQGNPGYALEMAFAGEPALSDYSNCEQHFDLGALYPEITLIFDLYVPNGAESWGGAAYTHRDGSTSASDNNKLFRLWGSTYDDREKVGATLVRAATSWSDVKVEWSSGGGGLGTNGMAGATFIRSADLGTWMTIKIYMKAATATTYGSMKVYKNGSLILDRSTTLDNYTAGEPHAYRYGYLLGTANSGFTDTTKLLIDNVVIYASEV